MLGYTGVPVICIQKEKLISLYLFLMQKYNFTHYTDEFGKFFLLPTLIDFNVDAPDDKRNDPTIFDPCTRVLKHTCIVGFRGTGSLRRAFNC